MVSSPSDGVELVWPTLAYLPSYVAALEQGWSPDDTPAAAAEEELAAIARDHAGTEGLRYRITL